MCERNKIFEENQSAANGHPSREYLLSFPDSLLSDEYKRRKTELVSKNGEKLPRNPIASSNSGERLIFTAQETKETILSISNHNGFSLSDPATEVERAKRIFPVIRREALRDLSKQNGGTK